jgi:hypothetical protein
MLSALVIILFLIGDCFPQVKEISKLQYFKQGDFEFSISVNAGNNTQEFKTTNYPDAINSQYKTEDIYIHLGASVGYYIIDNLSIEPEFNMELFFENLNTMFIGNLCYTFYKPLNNVYPYIKIGYGWAEYTNSYNYYLISSSDNYRIINSGLGLKFRFSSSAMFKTEINYRNLTTSFSTTNPFNTGSIKTEISSDIFSFSVGISVLI